MFEDLLLVARDYLRQAGEGFEKFAAYMIEQAGREVAPMLHTLYEAALTRGQRRRSRDDV